MRLLLAPARPAQRRGRRLALSHIVSARRAAPGLPGRLRAQPVPVRGHLLEKRMSALSAGPVSNDALCGLTHSSGVGPMAPGSARGGPRLRAALARGPRGARSCMVALMSQTCAFVQPACGRGGRLTLSRTLVLPGGHTLRLQAG